MGLERLAMIGQGKSSVFETDLFAPLIDGISGLDEKTKRIIADHIKGAVFLIAEGISPSNVERGYVLRRILRRAIGYGKRLNLPKNFLIPLAKKVIIIYKDVYPELKRSEDNILSIVCKEEEDFAGSEVKREKIAIKLLKEKSINDTVSGAVVHDINSTTSISPGRIEELAIGYNIKVIEKEKFDEARERHREISRVGAEKKFKGGLADDGAQTVKYHTATHLLLAALREVLGSEIYQKGSNITAERLRFDFNYPQKTTDVQIKEVEELVNQKIKEDVLVEMKEMPKAEALKIAKISFDPEKYGEIVKVYQIGDFSIELCGGSHVKRTSELGFFKIIKEESSGAGVRRIRAVLE